MAAIFAAAPARRDELDHEKEAKNVRREIKQNEASGALTAAEAKAMRATLKTFTESDFTGGQLFETGAVLQVSKHSTGGGRAVYGILPDVSLYPKEAYRRGDATPYYVVKRTREDARDAWEQVKDGDAQAYRLYDAVAEMARLTGAGYDLGPDELNISVDQNHELADIEGLGIPYEVLEGTSIDVGGEEDGEDGEDGEDEEEDGEEEDAEDSVE